MCLQRLTCAVDVVNSIASLNASICCVAADYCLITSVKTFFGSKTMSDLIVVYIVNYNVSLYDVLNDNVI